MTAQAEPRTTDLNVGRIHDADLAWIEAHRIHDVDLAHIEAYQENVRRLRAERTRLEAAAERELVAKLGSRYGTERKAG